MAISDIQIKACYDAALDMRDRKIGISDAKRQVESRSAMSQGSAMDYIYNVQKLLQGQCYTRTMNVVGTELILSWIHADFGEEAAFVAAHTVLEHVVYYSNLEKGGPQERIRRLAEKKIATLTYLTKVSQKMDEFRGDFQADIANSQQDTKEARQRRLARASDKPIPMVETRVVYRRNPDVVAEVLSRADGKCEHCKSATAFLRKSNGTPYLEVHHILPIGEGGPDNIENAIALCANCHRHAHFGLDWKGPK